MKMKHALRSSLQVAIAALASLVAASCASSRMTIPPVQTELPSYGFSALKATPLRLAVTDQRAERDESEAVVAHTKDSINLALTRAGVGVDPAAGKELVVKIVQLRADFGSGEWKGCTKFLATIELESKQNVEAERCVTKANLFGNASADEALKQSYRDALTELLSKLDSL